MARQRFGQHFLISPKILDRIAVAACGTRVQTAVEIGPGKGALTRHLLAHADRLIAIEIDSDLVRYLETEFAGEPRITIVHGDALQHDFTAFRADVICGNLPYYAATPILTRLVRAGVPVVALIQKEVADRVTAKPGGRQYGFLTCEIALFADATYLFGVKPGAFRPPPEVDSAVIRLVPNPRAEQLHVEPAKFLNLLSLAFQHKRKTLRNNLAARWAKELLDSIPAVSRRAEQMSLDDFAALYQTLYS